MTDSAESLGHLVGKVDQPSRHAGLASGFLVPGLALRGDTEMDLGARRVLLPGCPPRSFGSHAELLHTQIILDKPPAILFNVYTLNKEAVMAKKTEVNIPKAAAKAGLRLARRIFETRGNHSEVHLSEEELAVILSAAFQLGGDKPRKVLVDLLGKIEVMSGCSGTDFEAEHEDEWPEFKAAHEVVEEAE